MFLTNWILIKKKVCIEFFLFCLSVVFAEMFLIFKTISIALNSNTRFGKTWNVLETEMSFLDAF